MDIADSLHKYERAVLLALTSKKTVSDLARDTGLQEIEVKRGLQWLGNKELITLTETKEELIELEANGNIYSKQGLPERRALKLLAEHSAPNKGLSVQELVQGGIEPGEVNIIIGTLKKKAAIDVDKGPKGLVLRITAQGKKLLDKKTPEEVFLASNFPRTPESLSPEEVFAFDNLKTRRNIVRKEVIKTISVELSSAGKIVVQKGIGKETGEERLTSKMLKAGTWKNVSFRPYDVSINVPSIIRGRTHFVNEAIAYAKRIWLDMGFQEMSGTHVQTAFWDLDALFVPQDHPAREMQDTFYLEDPSCGKITNAALLKRIKAVHENGGDTGSKGWQTPYDKGTALLNMLRTHTTVLSAHTLSELKKTDMPAKFFTIGKVYRNETLDWKHLFEFHQVDGIVIDPNANLRQLKGYLEEFYKKMGFTKVRMRPAHFPYTEPSIEPEVWHPVRKEWIEMGGAGIFRPEVTKTLLGIEVPVLAWGLGLERIISPYYGISDIRELYGNDIAQLRKIKNYIR